MLSPCTQCLRGELEGVVFSVIGKSAVLPGESIRLILASPRRWHSRFRRFPTG